MKNDAIIRYDEAPGSMPPCPPVPSPESQAEKLRELLLDIVDEKLAEIIVTALTEDATDEEIPSARAVWGLKEEVDQMSEYADEAAASAAAAASSAEDAETAQSAAEDAQAAAAASATAAANSATAAAGSATAAASSATAAANSATAAGNAKSAAQAAQAAAEAAVTAAEAAGAEQIELIEAAGASERESLSGYADRAETAATNAEASAESIQGSVSDAAEYATAAGESATAAAASATQAVTAKTAAQSAKTAAEAAQASAEAAQGDAEAAATAAETAQTSAEAAQEAAEAAQTAAESAQSSAEDAATTAGNAATYAENKATAAGNAATVAENKATLAGESAIAAAASAAAAQAAAMDVIDKAPIITDTASGAIASFPDGSAAPIKQLTVAVNPVQDLHGYDAPWPAGGGVNILPPMVDGTYEGNGAKAVVKDGIATLSGTTTSSGNAFIIPLQAPVTMPASFYYHCGNSVVNGSLSPVIENSNNTSQYISLALSPANRISGEYTTKEGNTYDRIRFYLGSGVTISGTYAPMFCKDNTARSFAPYSNVCPITGWTGADVTVSPTLDAQDGQTYPITFPSEAGTVYGGTVTVNQDGTGTLVADMAHVDMGTLEWAYNTTWSNVPVFYAPKNDIKYTSSGEIPRMKCSQYKTVNANVLYLGENNACSSGSSVIRVRDNAYSDAVTFKAAMNGVQMVYELATPVTYTLTAAEMTTLFGQNNWWADCGDVSVGYRADTKLYIDKKLAALLAALS